MRRGGIGCDVDFQSKRMTTNKKPRYQVFSFAYPVKRRVVNIASSYLFHIRGEVKIERMGGRLVN